MNVFTLPNAFSQTPLTPAQSGGSSQSSVSIRVGCLLSQGRDTANQEAEDSQ